MLSFARLRLAPTRRSICACVAFAITSAMMAGSVASGRQQTPATASSTSFNPEAATQAYLDKVPPAQKARSDAYVEGGYWLMLWGFLYGITVNGLLLQAGWSGRMRDLAGRLTGIRFLRTWCYWAQYLIATTVLLFPLTVYRVDASRQTTRISASVSGFLGTERITLNDNLLSRGSLAEVKAVMGHELGHRLLNHAYEMLTAFSLVALGGFAFAQWGDRWRVHGVEDEAGLPLLVVLLSIYGFVLTPLVNTYIRANEQEAESLVSTRRASRTGSPR